MKDNWQSWPALAGSGDISGIELRCELGIWGKAHGQGSDYRWLARSERFASELPDLARSLRIGAEDRAARFFAWRALEAPAGLRYFALSVRPSQALDSSGRSALLDKLVLEWRPEGSCMPAALAALVWLAELERSSELDRWTSVGERNLGDADPTRAIAASECPTASLDAQRIAKTLDIGVNALAARMDRERLGQVYARLLAGEAPALLAPLAEPLPASALAALLLPLPKEFANRCSLASWLPSARLDRDDLGHNWDLVCAPQVPPTAAAGIDLDTAAHGALLAEALLIGEPNRLWTDAWGTLSSGPMRLTGEVERAVKPEAAFAAQAIRPSKSQRERGSRLNLRPPNRAGLGTLHRFADRIALRRLDLARVRLDLATPLAYPALAPGEHPSNHVLVDWLGALERGAPAGVDPDDWRFKTEQLRAAVLFLLPHPDTLALIGLPRNPHAPALLAALCSDPDASVARLSDHGPESLSLMVEHSRRCPARSLVSAIDAWISRWHIANTHPGLELGRPEKV
jgi:hypothetical protein